MYYILFETGNDEFFSRITDAFCSVILQSVIDIYKSGAFSQSNSPMIDVNPIDEMFKKQEESLALLNCGLFPGVYCGNQECAANNTAVLTSYQLDKFEISMTNANIALLRAKTFLNQPRIRMYLQRILQSYRSINIPGNIKQIHIKNMDDHVEYLRSYIEGTNRLKGNAEGFVYIRAETNSDFDYFKENTNLPNVMVCDHFQRIY